MTNLESEIESALSYISPDTSRMEWWKIVAAIKAGLGDSGFNLFDSWSRQSSKYRVSDARSTWNSTSTTGGITEKTLFKEAMDNGWRHSDEWREPTMDEEAKRLAQVAREKELMKKRSQANDAAISAKALYERAGVADPKHAYLVRKRCLAHEGVRETNDCRLVIPIYAAENITLDGYGRISLPDLQTVQTINPNGDKYLFKGAAKSGGCFVFGKIKDGCRINFAEGYATAATIFEATNEPTIMCVDSGNILHVAEAFAKKDAFAHCAFRFCADLDSKPGEDIHQGTGVKAVEKTMSLVKRGSTVSIPRFLNDEKGTDFNDLFVLRGRDAVLLSLKEKLKSYHDISIFPERRGKNEEKIVSCIENTAALLKEIGIEVKMNLLTHRIEFVCGEINQDKENNVPTYVCSEASKYGYNLSKNRCIDELSNIADANAYHPIRDWIESKPWDGKSRLDDLLKTVTVADSDVVTLPDGSKLHEQYITCWLFNAVKAVYSDEGHVCDGVLTFQGSQGIGKTRWVKALLPVAFQNAGYVKEGAIIDTSVKDTIISATSAWITELGELDGTLNRSEMSELKNFLTKQKDDIRHPYKASSTYVPRQTVFAATVNSDRFLKDETGNRRYWVIPAQKLNPDHGIDMQQLFAEIKVKLEQNPAVIHLPAEVAQAQRENAEQFMQTDFYTERLSTFPWDKQLYALTTTEVCFLLGVEKPQKTDLMQCAAALKKLNGGKNGRRRLGKTLQSIVHACPFPADWTGRIIKGRTATFW